MLAPPVCLGQGWSTESYMAAMVLLVCLLHNAGTERWNAGMLPALCDACGWAAVGGQAAAGLALWLQRLARPSERRGCGDEPRADPHAARDRAHAGPAFPLRSRATRSRPGAGRGGGGAPHRRVLRCSAVASLQAKGGPHGVEPRHAGRPSQAASITAPRPPQRTEMGATPRRRRGRRVARRRRAAVMAVGAGSRSDHTASEIFSITLILKPPRKISGTCSGSTHEALFMNRWAQALAS